MVYARTYLQSRWQKGWEKIRVIVQSQGAFCLFTKNRRARKKLLKSMYMSEFMKKCFSNESELEIEDRNFYKQNRFHSTKI